MSCSFLYGYAQCLSGQQDGGTRETKWKMLKPVSRQLFFLNKSAGNAYRYFPSSKIKETPIKATRIFL
jgi:hypothetical protein